MFFKNIFTKIRKKSTKLSEIDFASFINEVNTLEFLREKDIENKTIDEISESYYNLSKKLFSFILHKANNKDKICIEYLKILANSNNLSFGSNKEYLTKSTDRNRIYLEYCYNLSNYEKKRKLFIDGYFRK